MSLPVQDVGEFVAGLLEKSVHLTLDGDQLRYRAPPGALQGEDLEQIRARKPELVEFLRQSAQSREPVLLRRGDRRFSPPLFAQQSLVEVYKGVADPGSLHLGFAWRLRGHLEVGALGDAINAMFVRHPALRTRYVRGESAECVVETLPHVTVCTAIHDLSEVPENLRDSETRRRIVALTTERFDLQSGPLVRHALFRLEDAEHILVLIVHHSIIDMWSFGILSRDLFVTYGALANAETPVLPALELEFSDYASWVREWIHSEGGLRSLAFWRALLRSVENPFWLPKPHPDGGLPAEPHCGNSLLLTGAPLTRVRELARAEGSTVAGILLTAYVAALSYWAQSQSLLVVVAHFGRHLEQVWNLVGCFIQTWVLRADLQEDTGFRQLVRQITDRTAEAYKHIQVPFALLRPELAARAQEAPLLHILFNYRTLPGQLAQTPDVFDEVTISPFDIGSQSQALDENRGEKLNLSVDDRGDAIRLHLRYCDTRLSAQAVARFFDQFKAVLEHVMNDDGIHRPLSKLRAVAKLTTRV